MCPEKSNSLAEAAQKPRFTTGIVADVVALDFHAQSSASVHFWHLRSSLLAKKPSEHPQPPASGASRLRVMRTLREARQQAGVEDADIEELQQRLMTGHILSEHELELIRAADRSAR